MAAKNGVGELRKRFTLLRDGVGGAGAEWKNGLGRVLIGGLTSSMFLSLIIIPLVYYGFYRVKETSIPTALTRDADGFIALLRMFRQKKTV
jgi:hypothetical protein